MIILQPDALWTKSCMTSMITTVAYSQGYGYTVMQDFRPSTLNPLIVGGRSSDECFIVKRPVPGHHRRRRKIFGRMLVPYALPACCVCRYAGYIGILSGWVL